MEYNELVSDIDFCVFVCMMLSPFLWIAVLLELKLAFTGFFNAFNTQVTFISTLYQVLLQLSPILHYTKQIPILNCFCFETLQIFIFN